MLSIAAALCLALALAWHTGLTLIDHCLIHRNHSDGRVYRLGQGWISCTQLTTETRLAMAGLVAAAALVPARLAPGPWATAATLLCCCAALAVVLAERRFRGGRYTSVCLAVLAAALLLEQGATLVWGAEKAIVTGVFASFFAAQLYLVAGIRKLRSHHFMNGGVIAANIAYNSYQAAAGNRDFLPLPRLPTLMVLLRNSAFPLACGAAAVLTAAAELALGLGALGLIPATLILAVAVPIHLAFTAISPRRIVPFSAAALGLLLLATTHPLLSPVW
jgi:hypothetical protein